jgi:hypothetical protein
MNLILERLRKPIHIPAVLLWSLFAVFFGSPIIVLTFEFVHDPTPVGELRQWIQFFEFLILGTAALGAVAFIVAWCCAGLISVILAVATGRLCLKSAPNAAVSASCTGRRWGSLIWAVATGLVMLVIPMIWDVTRLVMTVSFLLVWLLVTSLYSRRHKLLRWEKTVFLIYVCIFICGIIPVTISNFMSHRQADARWMNFRAEMDSIRIQTKTKMSRIKAKVEAQTANLVVSNATSSYVDGPAKRLRYTLKAREDNAAFEMDGLTIVFEGVRSVGQQFGDIQVSGYGDGSSLSGTNRESFFTFYRKGISAFGLADRMFTFTDEGRVLWFGDQRIEMTNGNVTVLVSSNGIISVTRSDSGTSPKKAN